MVNNMYYFNSFLLYSILGFIMESTIYKFNDSNRHSGIFFGPITAVYGIGALFLILLEDFLDKFKLKKITKILIYFFTSMIVLTLIELIFGYLVNFIFNIDLWDYTNKKYNIGKYICLEISFAWGILSLIFAYIIRPFFDKHIKTLKKKESYIFMIVFLIDFIFTLIIKK